MGHSTTLGAIFGGITNPIGAVAGAFSGSAIDAVTGNPSAPNTAAPAKLDPSSAEYALAKKNQNKTGRAANQLTGQTSSLLPQSNLYSASKQLLGS